MPGWKSESKVIEGGYQIDFTPDNDSLGYYKIILKVLLGQRIYSLTFFLRTVSFYNSCLVNFYNIIGSNEKELFFKISVDKTSFKYAYDSLCIDEKIFLKEFELANAFIALPLEAQKKELDLRADEITKKQALEGNAKRLQVRIAALKKANDQQADELKNKQIELNALAEQVIQLREENLQLIEQQAAAAEKFKSLDKQKELNELAAQVAFLTKQLKETNLKVSVLNTNEKQQQKTILELQAKVEELKNIRHSPPPKDEVKELIVQEVDTLINNINFKRGGRAGFALNTESKVVKLQLVREWIQTQEKLDTASQKIVLSLIRDICSMKRNPLGFFEPHSKREFNEWAKGKSLGKFDFTKNLNTLINPAAIQQLINTALASNYVAANAVKQPRGSNAA